MVGIHEDGFPQIAGRSRGFTQDQHAVTLHAAGDVFLGHQVHAVAQRRDERDVGHAVKCGELLERETAVLVHDRGPADVAVFPVDASHHFVEILFHAAVLGHFLPRRHHRQDEDDLFLPVGVAVKKLSEPEQAMEDPLGIIEAIHRKQDLAVRAEVRAGFRGEAGHLGLRRGFHEAGGIDPDGKGVGLVDVVADLDAAEMVVMTQRAVNAAQEVLRVVVGVKAHEIRTEDASQQLLTPSRGQEPEHFEGRKRDVQKKADGQTRMPGPQQGGQQHQLIVLHPHAITRLDQAFQFVGEPLVALHVRLPLPGVIHGIRREVVQQRPQGLVAEPVIEIVSLVSAHENRPAAVRAHRTLTHVRLFLGRNVSARPANPDTLQVVLAFFTLKVGPQCRDQASRAGLEAVAAARVFGEAEREAVADDDQTGHRNSLRWDGEA